MKYLRVVLGADCQQGIAMSANYVRGSTVADFLQGTATGKNVGQSLKADCGELAARALLACFVLRVANRLTFRAVMQKNRAKLREYGNISQRMQRFPTVLLKNRANL